MRLFFWAIAAFGLLFSTGCTTDAEEALARGNLLRNEGDLSGAVTAYREAARLAEGRSEFSLRLGEALLDAGRLDEGQEVLEGILLTDPKHIEARLLLARHAMATGKRDAAMARLDEVLEQDPENLFALMSRGNLLLETGKTEEAVRDYARAVTVDGRNPSALYGHASALLAAGDRANARKTLEALEALDPDAPFGAYGLARLAATSERPETALPLLREALRRATARKIPMDRNELQGDPRLAKLRDLPEFQALLAELPAPQVPIGARVPAGTPVPADAPGTPAPPDAP